eukprot:17211-Heterococcus_DN1.PRE.3
MRHKSYDVLLSNLAAHQWRSIISKLSANNAMYAACITITHSTVTGPLTRSHPAEKLQQQYLN